MSDTAAPAPAEEAGRDRFTVTDYAGTAEATPAPEPAAESNPPGEGEPPAQAETTEEPAASDDTPADDPSAEDTEPKKARGGFQKRIGELTARLHAAEREKQALLDALQRPAAAPQQQPQDPAKPQAEPQLPPDLAQAVGAPPNPADFPAGEFDPAYTEAKVMHRLKTEQAKVELQRREHHAKQQQAEITQRVRDLITEGNNRHADFEEVALSSDIHMPAHVVRELAECDDGSEVAYWLGKNPGEAKRIAALPPTKVARELAKIEAKLAAPPPPPKPSAAPPPPPATMRGRGAVQPTIYDVGDDYAAYKRLRTGG